MDIKKYISNRILQLCEANNLTINGLARASKLGPTTVKNVINGASQNPGIITLQKICNGLGISLIEFFDTEEFNQLEKKAN